MDFLEKLDMLMTENSLNKSTLSKACDIPYTTIDGWYKKGYEGVKLTTLRKLSSFFSTSLDFWVEDTSDATSHLLSRNKPRFSIHEEEHIKKYRALDEHGKDMVDTVLEKEHNRCAPPKLAIVARGGITVTPTREARQDVLDRLVAESQEAADKENEQY